MRESLNAEVNSNELPNPTENTQSKFDTSDFRDISGDGVHNPSVSDTSVFRDISGDGYDSGDFASEKDGNKESEGQIKENAVAEENKPKETTEQSEPKKGDENTDTSDDNLTDEEKDLIKNATDDSEKERECDKYKGGSYGELKNEGHGDNSSPPQEVHHMPADDINGLKKNDGPAIAMDKEDHRQTASCGNSKEAKAYRAEQSRLISEGKFEEAMQMDIDDIHEKFGSKYDEAIEEMKAYAKENGYI